MPREPEIAPAPSPFARGPTGLSGRVTAALTIALLAALFAYSFGWPTLVRALAFDRAPESVTRVCERRLELAAALDDLPAWERQALTPFVPADSQTFDDAVRSFRAVFEVGHRWREDADDAERAAHVAELDGLRARRALLLAGRGRIEEAQGDLDELARDGHDEFVAAVRALPSGRSRVEDLALAGDGWIARVAVARLRGEARPTPGRAVHMALNWARGLACTTALGVLVLLGWLLRDRPDVTAGTIVLPSPWTPQLGFAVLVRAAFYAVVILAISWGWGEVAHSGLPRAFGTAAAALPLFHLVRRHLVRPHRLETLDVIGVPAVRSTVVLSSLALFAVVQVGGRALATAATAVGAAEPWTFRVSPSTIWSSDAAFAFEAAIQLIFGVLAIELAFRGVLFPSLRHVHGPIHSAVLTGMLFSAVHFASLPTMLALAWGGFAAALAVERTRSLLPAIACAVFSGLFETSLAGALYR
jgi:membrane protease YdiL (CAAX protease family)